MMKIKASISITRQVSRVLQVVLLGRGSQGWCVSPLIGGLGGGAVACTDGLRGLQVQNTLKSEARERGLDEHEMESIIREVQESFHKPRIRSACRAEAHTCLQRVSSLCLFLFFRSILVKDGLKSKSSKSAQSSESFVDRDTRPHLLRLLGLISPFLGSRPASIFCASQERGIKQYLALMELTHE